MVLRREIIDDFEDRLVTEAPPPNYRRPQETPLQVNDGVPFEIHNDSADQGIPSSPIDIFGTTKPIKRIAIEDLTAKQPTGHRPSPSQELAAITAQTKAAKDRAVDTFQRILKKC